jgi:hypothetical protein
VANRKSLVLRGSGPGFEEKPSTDFVDGAVAYNVTQGLTAAQQAQARANISAGSHAKFTGTITPPALALLGTSTVTVAGLTPVTTGDSLTYGEYITLHINAGSSLPSGLVVSYEPQVTAANTVTVKLVATIALGVGTAVPVTILAHR